MNQLLARVLVMFISINLSGLFHVLGSVAKAQEPFVEKSDIQAAEANSENPSDDAKTTEVKGSLEDDIVDDTPIDPNTANVRYLEYKARSLKEAIFKNTLFSFLLYQPTDTTTKDLEEKLKEQSKTIDRVEKYFKSIQDLKELVQKLKEESPQNLSEKEKEFIEAFPLLEQLSFENQNALKLLRHVIKGKILEKDLQGLVTRAKYPGAQGKYKEPVRTHEIEDAQEKVKTWGKELSTIFTGVIPKEASLDFDFETEIQQEINAKAILFYFNLVGAIAVLRLTADPKDLGISATDNPVSKAWQDSLALRLHHDVLVHAFPNFDEIRQAMQQAQLPFLVLRDSSTELLGMHDIVINPSYLQGVEMSLLTANVNEENALALAQLHATRRLIESHERLRLLLPYGRVTTIPQIPESLQQKFKTLGTVKTIAEAERRVTFEKLRKQAIREAYSEKFSEKLPTFLTKELASKIHEELKKDPRNKKLNEEKLYKVLKEVESAKQLDGFTNFSFTQETDSEKSKEALREAIAHSKALEQWIKIKQLGIATEEEPLVEKSVLNTLFARKAEYKKSIEDSTLESLLASAEAMQESDLQKVNREQFVRNLISLSKEMKKSRDGDVVQPQIIAQAIEPFVSSLGVSGTTRKWMSRIFGQPTWTESQKTYFQVLAINSKIDPQRLTPDKIESTPVDPQTGTFIPEIDYYPPKPSKLAKELGVKTKKDVEDLVKIGEHVGFHSSDNKIWKTEPTVEQALKDEKEKKRYVELYDQLIISKVPVLQTRIPRKGFAKILDWVPSLTDYFSVTKQDRLYDVLAKTNFDPSKKITPEQEAINKGEVEKVEDLVEQSLEKISQNIADQIEKLGHAKKIEDIGQIFMSSYILSLFTDEQSGYSVYARQHNQVVQELFKPHFLTRGFYSSNYHWWPATTVLLLGAASFVSKFLFTRLPFVSYIIQAESAVAGSAYMAGYNWGINILFWGQMGAGLYGIHKYHNDYMESEKVFLTSATGQGLSNYDQVDAYKKQFETAETSYLWNAAVLAGIVAAFKVQSWAPKVSEQVRKVPGVGSVYGSSVDWFKSTKFGKTLTTPIHQWVARQNYIYEMFRNDLEAFKAIQRAEIQLAAKEGSSAIANPVQIGDWKRINTLVKDPQFKERLRNFLNQEAGFTSLIDDIFTATKNRAEATLNAAEKGTKPILAPGPNAELTQKDVVDHALRAVDYFEKRLLANADPSRIAQREQLGLPKNTLWEYNDIDFAYGTWTKSKLPFNFGEMSKTTTQKRSFENGKILSEAEFNKMVELGRPRPTFNVHKDQVTINEMIKESIMFRHYGQRFNTIFRDKKLTEELYHIHSLEKIEGGLQELFMIRQ